jgi:translation initiation factor IF-3
VDQGRKLLDKLIDFVKDLAVIESPPKLEGKRLTMVLAPAPSSK